MHPLSPNIQAYKIQLNQCSATILNIGACIQSLCIDGADLVLGFDQLEYYLENKPYFGAVCGRFANRIDHGQLSIGDDTYQLSINHGEHHLHGGHQGFSHKLWRAKASEREITLTYESPHGEEGYPGQVNIQVSYKWVRDRVLSVDYSAVTDQETVINPTQHSYFNLNGHDSGSIRDHSIRIFASSFTELDSSMIPTGRILPVQGSAYDLRELTTILGEDGQGFDINFVLDKSGGSELCLASEVTAAKSGRRLRVYTDQPGLQLYTGQFLGGQKPGKNGFSYPTRSGFCLEAQHYPNSPNHKNFTSTLLRPGDVYRQTTLYDFS